MRVNYTGYIWLYIPHAKSEYERVLVEYQRGSTWIDNIFKLQTFLGYQRPRGESSMLSIISSGAMDERNQPPNTTLASTSTEQSDFWGGGISNFCRVQVSYPSSVGLLRTCWPIKVRNAPLMWLSQDRNLTKTLSGNICKLGDDFRVHFGSRPNESWFAKRIKVLDGAYPENMFCF